MTDPGARADRGAGRRRRLGRVILGTALAALVALAVYTVWDNGRFVVASVTIEHPDLPAAFDGYRIVQVSDLHGARFGVRQKDLLKAITDARPDLILLTGDYPVTAPGDSETDLAPVSELVAGLPRGVPVRYILGNWDMAGLHRFEQLAVTPLVETLESNGAEPIHPYTDVTRGDSSVRLTDVTMREFRDRESLQHWEDQAFEEGGVAPSRVARWAEAWWTRQHDERGPADIFEIAVVHRPIQYADYDAALARNASENARSRAAGTADPLAVMVDYDVSISGHAHGGQGRLPFVGPLIAPDGTLFPDPRYIEGVHRDASGRVDYISRGLGSGGWVPFLRFRFLNTPELSVITLRKGVPRD